MNGIIIAGGLGTRLRPLTYNRPKPLVPVVNRPFLEYQVALLRKHGIDDIVFATNYMADKIEGHFGDGSKFGVRMRYAVEDTPLGTGGAIRNAADLFPGQQVAVFNGDVLTDYDLSSILEFHSGKQAIATITLQPVARPNAFGVLLLDADDKVKEWNEPSEEAKKALAQARAAESTGTDLINAGFYVFSAEFIAAIPQGRRCSIERDIFPTLISKDASIYGISPGGFWMDLGHAEQLMAASRAVLDGSVTTHTESVEIVSPELVSENARIEGLTSTGRNVSIGSGTCITDCIIMDNVSIGANAVLSYLIIDENTIIEDDVVLEGREGGATSVVAACSVVKQGSRIHYS